MIRVFNALDMIHLAPPFSFSLYIYAEDALHDGIACESDGVMLKTCFSTTTVAFKMGAGIRCAEPGTVGINGV